MKSQTKIISICGVAKAGQVENLTFVANQILMFIDLGDLVAVGYQLKLPKGVAVEQATEDFEWLSKQAIVHSQVIQELSNVCTVLPLRLGAFFASVQVAQDALRLQYPGFSQQLANIEGRQEWSFKVYQGAEYDEDFIQNVPELAEMAEKLNTMSIGRAFMMRKRFNQKCQEELQKSRNNQLNDVVNQLSICAEQVHQGKLASKKLTGRKDDMVLNLSVLIKEDDEEYLKKLLTAQTLNFPQLGLEAVLSGPYPVFHFLENQEEASLVKE